MSETAEKIQPAAFSPKLMRYSILTAAFQELTPRDIRDADPDRAIEDWAAYAAGELGVNRIQLSSAVHPSRANVPPEAMMDPVANHLDLREPFTEARARRVQKALDANKVKIGDIGYFDDHLHADPEVRRQKYEFMVGVMDAAQRLGVKGVCGFVGRWQGHDMDQNLRDFEEYFVPLLKEAKKRGLVFRVEQCPMPGWNTTDTFINNIAYAPGMWIELYKIADRNGVGDQFRIHYDASHSILIGQSARDVFQVLKDKGYPFLIGGFHSKGQVIDPVEIALWGYHGRQVGRGDRVDGNPHPDPKQQGNAWQVMPCAHELPGTARYNPQENMQRRTVDWLDQGLAARELLDMDPEETEFVLEHEFNPARYKRTEDKPLITPVLKGSLAFLRYIDGAAAGMYALQHEVLPSLGIEPQGRVLPPYSH